MATYNITPPGVEDFGRTFDMLSDPVVITDNEGYVRYLNRAMEYNSGFFMDEAVGKKPEGLWGGNMGEEFYEHMWHTIHVEKKAFISEVQNNRKDGTMYWQELHISPILNGAGDIEFFIGIEFDISKRKEKERFRDEFTSIVSHQLRNPLQTISLLTELLSGSKTMTSEDKKSIELISDENRGLSGFIRDLLTLSKLGDNKLTQEVVSLSDEIQKIVVEVQANNPHVTISLTTKGRTFPLTINKLLAIQVFSNLIYNAAEYADKKVEVSLEKIDSKYVFSCHNDGLTILEKDTPQIFSKFFRSSLARKRKETGDGLGLYIVKTITDEFGWDVWFDSAASKGTTFYVNLFGTR